jgi:hypothetical protein
MPSFTVTVRCPALAGFGALPASAQSANVTAFNPHDGGGSSSPAPSGPDSEQVDVLGP